jgi:hypothetical protein
MRYLGLGLAIVALGLSVEVATAQQKKKQTQTEEPASSASGHQKCEGSLFFLQDGIGPLCRRRDGKVCQVRGDSSGSAILADCK